MMPSAAAAAYPERFARTHVRGYLVVVADVSRRLEFGHFLLDSAAPRWDKSRA